MWQGYCNTDKEMSIILQSVLAKNYPKVRKGLYVFPINWFVQVLEVASGEYGRGGAEEARVREGARESMVSGGGLEYLIEKRKKDTSRMCACLLRGVCLWDDVRGEETGSWA